MKMIEIRRFKEQLFFNACSTTISGFWIGTKPFFVISEKSIVSQKADIFHKTFDGSIQNVPIPTNWKEFHKEYLHNLGLKNKDINEGNFIQVTFDGKKMEFYPTKNLGKNQGSEQILNAKIVIKELSDDIISQTIDLALNLCE